jgi:hypothetical protein
MINELKDSLVFIAALITGGAAGYGFGKMQDIARARYYKKQNAGKLKNSLTVIPGSMQRTAVFLLLLVLLQLILPFLFEGNIQWIVSAGVILGYGYTLLQQLKNRAVGKS